MLSLSSTAATTSANHRQWATDAQLPRPCKALPRLELTLPSQRSSHASGRAPSASAADSSDVAAASKFERIPDLCEGFDSREVATAPQRNKTPGSPLPQSLALFGELRAKLVDSFDVFIAHLHEREAENAKQLRESEDENAQLLEQIRESEDEKANLLEQIRESKDEIAALQGQLAVYATNLSELDGGITYLVENLRQSEYEFNDLQGQLSLSSNMPSASTVTTSELEHVLDSFEDLSLREKATPPQGNENLGFSLPQTGEAENGQLQMQLAASATRLSELGTEVTKILKLVRENRAENAQLQGQLAVSATNVTERDLQITQLVEEIRQDNAQLKELQEQLSLSEQANLAAKQETRSAKQEIAIAKYQCNWLILTLVLFAPKVFTNSSGQSPDDINAQVDAKKAEINKQVDSFSTARPVDEAEAAVVDLYDQITDLKERLCEAQNAVVVLYTKNMKLDEKLNHASACLHDAEAEITELTKQLDLSVVCQREAASSPEEWHTNNTVLGEQPGLPCHSSP